MCKRQFRHFVAAKTGCAGYLKAHYTSKHKGFFPPRLPEMQSIHLSSFGVISIIITTTTNLSQSFLLSVWLSQLFRVQFTIRSADNTRHFIAKREMLVLGFEILGVQSSWTLMCYRPTKSIWKGYSAGKRGKQLWFMVNQTWNNKTII